MRVMSEAYTTMARSLVAVAEALMKALGKRPVGAGRRVLQIKEPLGPSSEGGKLSRQVLVLTRGSSAIAIGWIDAFNGECAVKEFPILKLGQELRGGEPIDFTVDDYAAFTGALSQELASMGIKFRVDVVESSELRTEKTLRPHGRGVDPIVVVLAVLLVGLVAVAVMLGLR